VGLTGTLLSTWKVETQYVGDVSFDFGTGFGCGASKKVSVGQKMALQTQFNAGAEVGSKVGPPGLEVAAKISAGFSETLSYEFTVAEEWTYSSRSCEFCTPRIHFPNARVTQGVRYFLHVPLFVSRKTIFTPGGECEIRGHCRHSPEKCGNCADARQAEGTGPLIGISPSQQPSHMDRVIHADRANSFGRLEDLLQEILKEPEHTQTGEPQLYVCDVAGKISSVGSSENADYQLYSIDELDRVLGAIRLYPGSNHFLMIKRKTESSRNTTAHASSDEAPPILLFAEQEQTPVAVSEDRGETRSNDYESRRDLRRL
jgi:hypothetical protein